MTFSHCPTAGLCANPSVRCLLLNSAPALLRPVPPTPFVTRKPLAPQLHHPLSHSFDSAKLFPGRKRPGRCRRRRRLFPSASSSLELPLLPFNTSEVLVPSESKVLHLYEARYLALLEESLSRKNLFVHFVLEPIFMPGSSDGTSFAAKYGCLVLIEKVEQLDVGALVSIRGVGRVKLLNFVQAEPFLKGLVKPVQDSVAENPSETSSKVDQLKESLCNLIKLEIKLKAPKEALLQTHTANSLRWAENTPSVGCEESFIPSLAERVSFAALQPVSGSTESELLKLQREKLRAMDIKETLERLEDSLALVKENISIVAAKLAIQSLGM
ncbi:hypothetical protein EUGRSUZ_F02989 [Eucalyptus grandis]|uniref:Uncharacterized protein n=2 Tax=Eucalyptus grandis TaxID=71139 RepID=A0ACC3KLX8_EUCGR|nr:hypothetical protein EUGRSUZ_F02989 [Eucalyptus grandis]